MNDPHPHSNRTRLFTINPGDIITVPPEAIPFFHRPQPRFHPPLDHDCAQPKMVRLQQPDTSQDRWRFPANSHEKGNGLVMFGPALPPEGGKIRVIFRDATDVCAVSLDQYEKLIAVEAAAEA